MNCIDNFQQNKYENEIKTERERKFQNTLTQLQNRISDNEKCLNTIRQEYPISDQEFDRLKTMNGN